MSRLAGPRAVRSPHSRSGYAGDRSFRPAPESAEDQETERREHQNDPDVGYQSLREVVPEEQDVRADHDAYHREHVQHDACLSCHSLVLHDVAGQRRQPKVTRPLGQYVHHSRASDLPSVPGPSTKNCLAGATKRVAEPTLAARLHESVYLSETRLAGRASRRCRGTGH